MGMKLYNSKRTQLISYWRQAPSGSLPLTIYFAWCNNLWSRPWAGLTELVLCNYDKNRNLWKTTSINSTDEWRQRRANCILFKH